MNKQIARELHRRNIYGDFKAPHRYSTMCNSFGRSVGERAPDYRNVRHLLRLDRTKIHSRASHREVLATVREIKKQLGL